MARGGKREGSGRKPGSLNVRSKEIAEKAMAEGRTPLEIMLENMHHFQKVAQDAEAVIESLTPDDIRRFGDSPTDQFKGLLAEVKKAANFRQMAHECAKDAAGYMHPRLASIQHSGALDITTQTKEQRDAAVAAAKRADS